MEKLVENSWWRLEVLTKTGGLPCAMRLLMKRFSELHALGLFDAVFKLMLREDLRLSELNLLLNLARVFLEFHGEYWEFSLLAKCRRCQFSPQSVWSSTTGYYTCLSSWGHSFELAKVLMPERCLTTLETGVINASFKPTNALRVTKNTFCGLGRTPPKKSSKTF